MQVSEAAAIFCAVGEGWSAVVFLDRRRRPSNCGRLQLIFESRVQQRDGSGQIHQAQPPVETRFTAVLNLRLRRHDP